MAVYSHSRIETFETCPLKYKFQYIERIPKVEESVEAFVGSRVHDTLEKLYKDLQLEKLNTLDELLSYYETQWQREWSPVVKIRAEGLSERNYFAYGAKCIRTYYERYEPFNQSQTLATELKLEFALDADNCYRLLGFVDRAARRPDGTYEIHDYKTSRRLPAQKDVDRDRQLALYQLGLKQHWPEAERVELIWHYVGHDATLKSRRTPEHLEELRSRTIEMIRRIEAEANFEPIKGDHCEWCEYQPVCPVWKHVFAVRSLPPAQLAADEGVRLANELAETKRQLKLLEQRELQFRELIIEFCRQKGVTVLQGSNVRVNVSFRPGTNFPGKDDENREALEVFVKQAGKWEEVSDLNTHALVRVLTRQDWPPELLERLRRFASEAETATVSVSQPKEIEE